MEPRIGVELNHNLETNVAQEPPGSVAEKLTKANVLLWITQGLLAALFLLAGAMKLILLEAVTNQMVLPGLFMKFN